MKNLAISNHNNTSIRESVNFGKMFILSLLIIITLTLASCASPAEKLDNAAENATEAQIELDKAQVAYEADVKLFKIEISEQIVANENEIAAINTKIQNSNTFERANYEKQILVLEQNNEDLKKTMNEYKAEDREDWELFKTELRNDINELGLALKNFVVN